MGSRRAHFEASQVHVQEGLKLKKAGELEKALVEFQKALLRRSKLHHRTAGDQRDHRNAG